MPKLHTITTNFTAGVFSPRLRGRVDIEKFNSSMRDASDVVVLKHGGVTARPSTDYIGTVANQANTTRLLPFVYSNSTSYTLEFGDLTLRIRKGDDLVESSPGVPLVLVTPYTSAMLAALDFTQSGDTMILFHPSVHPQRLLRYGDTVWQLANAPFNPGPLGEVGTRADVDMVLSAVAVGSRTLTAASAFFRQGDVGRTFSSGSGTARITAYTSQTVVTAEVTVAFADVAIAGNTWLLEGSPLAQITPDISTPVGQVIVFEGAVPLWRPADVGSYVSINGGFAKLTAVVGIAAATDTYNGDGADTTWPYTFQILAASEITVTVGGVAQTYPTDFTLTNVGDAAGGDVVFAVAPAVGVGNIVISRAAGAEHKAFGTIIQELTATVAAPSDAWALMAPVWNAIDGYPCTGTFFQQRLWGGDTARYPISKWGSRSGLYFDFMPGPDDDSAVYKTIDSKQATPIRFLHGAKTLMALTDGSEYDVRGGVEKPITQTNASIARQTKWGCAAVKPEEVGDNVLFVQRGGRVIRATMPLDVEGFAARDISIYSEHLVRAGVRAMSFQQDPESVCWVATTDGALVAITYAAEQNVIAFAPSTLANGGLVESVCTVPEGTTDATYLVVVRGSNRYVEKINWEVNPGMDSRVAVSGASATTWSGFSHLVGKTVAVLANGVYVGTKVVSAGGQITLDETATSVIAGLPYTPSVTLHDPEVATANGTAQGQNINTSRITVRVHETIGCSVNGEALPWEQFDADTLDNQVHEFSGDKDVTDYGWTKSGGTAPLVISQPHPYPWTVLAVIREVTVNAG